MSQYFRLRLALIFISVFSANVAWADESASPDMPQFKWSGDLRVRTKLEKNGDSVARTNEQLRARFGVNVSINPELEASVRLATAKAARSHNQNLGDSAEPGARRRFIGLDQGYILWTPVDFFKLYAGRHPQLHYRPGGSQVLLDEDISLEGAAFSIDYIFREHWRVFVAAGSDLIRENYDTYYSEDQTDNALNWGQLGLEFKREPVRLVVGAGFFNFNGLKNAKFADLSVGGTAFGNSEGAPDSYKYAYLPRQYFAELMYKFSSFEGGVFGERIDNPEAIGANSASWTGMSLAYKTLDSQLAYAEIGKDSVVGQFTYSDFSGGATDSRGWIAAVRWKCAKNMNLRLTEFVNRSEGSTRNKEYHRTHFDINAAF